MAKSATQQTVTPAVPATVATPAVEGELLQTQVARAMAIGELDAKAAKDQFARTCELADMLRGQPYTKWDIVSDSYKKGATLAGYEDAQKLWERNGLAPLKLLGISKPASETSSAQRVLSAEAQAKADKRAAEQKVLDDMTIPQVEAKVEALKGDADADVAELATYSKLLVSKRAAKFNADKKADKDLREKLTKPIAEILKTIPTGNLGVAHACIMLCVNADDDKKMKALKKTLGIK